MSKMNMIQSINLALDQEMQRDSKIIIMGEDVGVTGGVFRATNNLINKYSDKRVIDTPLAEAAIIGTALGMALAGLRPVVEIQFAGFSYVAFSQLEGHISRYRWRTQGLYTVPLVVRMPYGAGVRALEHHSESREAYFAHTPGLKVVIPSTPRNARALLVSAIRDPDPVIFMEPTKSYRAFKEEVPETEEIIPIGKAQIIQQGEEITVISYGAMMRSVLKAAAEIEHNKQDKQNKKNSIEIIDLLTISPLDIDTICESVKKTGRCVIVQEAPRSFSVASEIIATINDKILMHLKAPVKRITGYDLPMPYFKREEMYIPSISQISNAIEETLKF
ncbi:MAG: alpha-ketoacid dehydrogenase subunit beta [Oligoflexia bacterium]|nr:alpha-ketoacid dehydrogenase subunit beta [Oligoflexia bacterium]